MDSFGYGFEKNYKEKQWFFFSKNKKWTSDAKWKFINVSRFLRVKICYIFNWEKHYNNYPFDAFWNGFKTPFQKDKCWITHFLALKRLSKGPCIVIIRVWTNCCVITTVDWRQDRLPSFHFPTPTQYRPPGLLFSLDYRFLAYFWSDLYLDCKQLPKTNFFKKSYQYIWDSLRSLYLGWV